MTEPSELATRIAQAVWGIESSCVHVPGGGPFSCRQCLAAEIDAAGLRDLIARERALVDANHKLIIGSAHDSVRLRDLIRERDEERAKLQRVRDWLVFAANSEGGIVAEIDGLLLALADNR